LELVPYRTGLFDSAPRSKEPASQTVADYQQANFNQKMVQKLLARVSELEDTNRKLLLLSDSGKTTDA
jgi:hypothetical protein